MTYRSPKTALRALYQTANGQGGYRTSKQAAAAGYTKQHVDYHVKAGNFKRISHGLYRLPTIPISEQTNPSASHCGAAGATTFHKPSLTRSNGSAIR
jgi:hypothetical protein